MPITKELKIFKETAVPTTWVKDSIYIITSGTNFIEIYVTSSSAVPRRLHTDADITAMIATQISSASSMKIVADIPARNALSPTSTMAVYVKAATADPTVTSGGAYYLYDTATSTWIKTGEAESMDVTLAWSSLTGKPTSSASAIDNAVSAAHSHTNKTQLDLITQNASGNLQYNGSLPYTGWEGTPAW